MFSKIKKTFFGYIPFLSPQNFPKEATDSCADNIDSPPIRISSQPIAPSTLPQLSLSESILLDVFDCWCHAVIVDSNQEQVDVRDNNLKDVRHALLGTMLLNPRSNARFILAEHAKELHRWQLTPKEGSVSPDKFTTDDWKRLRDEWNEMRKAVVLARPDHEENDLLQEDFRVMQRLIINTSSLFCAGHCTKLTRPIYKKPLKCWKTDGMEEKPTGYKYPNQRCCPVFEIFWSKSRKMAPHSIWINVFNDVRACCLATSHPRNIHMHA